MTKKDILLGLLAGLMMGIFAIPFVTNTNLIQKIPQPYIVLLIVLPIAAAIGVAVAGLIGRKIMLIWQVAKFGLVGVLNTLIDLGIYNLLISATGYDKGNPVVIFGVISFSAAVINSYTWNKKWVFVDGQSQNRQFLSFIIVSLIAAGVAAGIIKVMTEYMNPVGGLTQAQWANVPKLIAIAFSLVWNYLGYKFIVFKSRT